MIHWTVDPNAGKAWFGGPWGSALPIPVGYATQGVDENHVHTQMFEVFFVARGNSTAVVNQTEVHLATGDVLVVEPGEVHTFTRSSDDYLHFVIQAPFVPEDKSLH